MDTRSIHQERPPEKSGNQRNRILALLRERGTAGVVNLELYRICLRPPSRICELRQAGYDIETRREGEGRFRFVLLREPTPPDYARGLEKRLHDDAMPLFSGAR